MKSGVTVPVCPVQLAVTDISSARTPGQFKLKIEPNREWVRHEVVAWSVGLKWLTFYFGNTVDNITSPLFVAGRDDEYLATVEQSSMEEWMQEHRHSHMETHEAAILRGLAPGGENDLPVERITIDRLLKKMVKRDGIDVVGPAEAIANDEDYIQFLANNLEYMGMYVNDRYFQLRQLGLALPVLSTWMPLGRATYCGHALDLDYRLPEAICDGVVGRRLGDVIATGIPALDARVIAEVVSDRVFVMDHWPCTTQTRIYLEPDLVELGRGLPQVIQQLAPRG